MKSGPIYRGSGGRFTKSSDPKARITNLVWVSSNGKLTSKKEERSSPPEGIPPSPITDEDDYVLVAFDYRETSDRRSGMVRNGYAKVWVKPIDFDMIESSGKIHEKYASKGGAAWNFKIVQRK